MWGHRGEEAVDGTGGRAVGWSEKIARAPRRCRRRRRRRRRHRRGRGRRGRGRHSLPCAGARRAHGRPLHTTASAAGSATTSPAAVAAAPTRRARVLRERTRPRRPQHIRRQHDPLFGNSKTKSSIKEGASLMNSLGACYLRKLVANNWHRAFISGARLPAALVATPCSAVPANACCPENHLWGSVAPINPHRRWQACAFCAHFGMPLRDMCTAAHGSRSFPKATDGTGT